MLSFCALIFATIQPLSIPTSDAQYIAQRIWKNECGGSIEGLTCWNKGENFPSLGIGHFIWYPKGVHERFEETFPKFVAFLQAQDVEIPEWLAKNSYSPWNTREEFYANIASTQMQELRELLIRTKDQQALFISQRLVETLPKMLETLQKDEQTKVSKSFYLVASTPKGVYALIDYLNFKGSGLSANESYNGQGWGLLQVLQRVHPASPEPLQEFVNAASYLLEQRVKNSPAERNEAKWLPGWKNRLHTYL
ncbi:MAG: hypothetical protein H0X51_06290 [Parachlamydiaceae bacterium]|nr:hypothetical protein [Parachlamydiaceae bacterium]